MSRAVDGKARMMFSVEDVARAAATCPACGAAKTVGALVCWGRCWSGPRGLKYSGLGFAEWFAARPVCPPVPVFDPAQCGGAFDGFTVTSDADGGL